MPWELSPYVFNSGKQFCMIMRGSSMSKTEHNLKATMYAAYATRRKLHGFIRNKTQLPGIYLNKLVVYYDTTLSNTQQRKVYLWKYVCWVPIISRASGRVGMRHVSDRAPDLGLKIPGREVFQKSVQPYMNSYEHNMSCSIQTNTICFAHTIDCIYWNKNSNLPGTRPCYWQIMILQPHQIQPWKNSMDAMGNVDICGTLKLYPWISPIPIVSWYFNPPDPHYWQNLLNTAAPITHGTKFPVLNDALEPIIGLLHGHK